MLEGKTHTYDNKRVTVQHSQSFSGENMLYERDLEKEKENGDFFKHLSCHSRELAFDLKHSLSIHTSQKSQLNGTSSGRPIFLEFRNLRI